MYRDSFAVTVNATSLEQFYKKFSRDSGGTITASIPGWTVKRSFRNSQVAQQWEPPRSSFKRRTEAIDLHDPLMMFKLTAF